MHATWDDAVSMLQAFLLVITHEYKSLRDRDVFISLFEPLAKYVRYAALFPKGACKM